MGSQKQHIKSLGKQVYFNLLSAFATKDVIAKQETLILNYHHIIPDEEIENNLLFGYAHSKSAFHIQMGYLSSIASSALTFDAPKAFVVTFDDCSMSTFKHALPILDEFGIKAHFFIVEDMIGRSLWIDDYFLWISYVPFGTYTICDKTISIKSHTDRMIAHHSLWKMISDGTHPDLILDAMRVEYTLPINLILRLTDRMNTIGKEQIDWLKSNGHKIGFHSRTHALLSSIQKEVLSFECKPKDPTLFSERVFAIPFGWPEAYNERVINELKQNNYEAILLNHALPPSKGLFGRLNLPDTNHKSEIHWVIRQHLKKTYEP
jgi:peptidoglycan/xylan/chitin deacetylase (PgdA/CDA1 family)